VAKWRHANDKWQPSALPANHQDEV
jgi:hypothetical protein